MEDVLLYCLLVVDVVVVVVLPFCSACFTHRSDSASYAIIFKKFKDREIEE